MDIEIQAQLTKFVRKYYIHRDRSYLLHALTSLFDLKKITEMVEQIYYEEDLLRKVWRRTYLHDQGYVDIEILSSPDYQLSLWIYPKGEKMQPSHVCSFCRDTATILIGGEVHLEKFEKDPYGRIFYLYEYKPEGNAYRIIPKDISSLSCELEVYAQEGSGYIFSYENLYRITGLKEQPAIFLVLQGPARTSYVTVYSPEQYMDTQKKEIKRLTLQEVKAELYSCLVDLRGGVEY